MRGEERRREERRGEERRGKELGKGTGKGKAWRGLGHGAWLRRLTVFFKWTDRVAGAEIQHPEDAADGRGAEGRGAGGCEGGGGTVTLGDG